MNAAQIDRAATQALRNAGIYDVEAAIGPDRMILESPSWASLAAVAVVMGGQGFTFIEGASTPDPDGLYWVAMA